MKTSRIVTLGLGLAMLFPMLCLRPAMAITYTYDNLNRLVTVTYDNQDSLAYSYDAAGNIVRIQANDTIDPGDVNGDGFVNLADAILALEVVSARDLAVQPRYLADINGDNKIGMAEVLHILQRMAGLSR